MKGIKEIRQRIKIVDGTAKITKAMQLVAASKMKKAQALAIGSRKYIVGLTDIIGCMSLTCIEKLKSSRFFNINDEGSRCVIVVASDKGLCGAMNNNIFREAAQVEKDAQFIAVGKKATNYLSRCARKLVASFSINDISEFHEILGISELVMQLYESGEISRCDVLYSGFKNTLAYVPVYRRILPMVDFYDEFKKITDFLGIDSEILVKDKRKMIFEPSPAGILDSIVKTFIKHGMYQSILEAKASEHSARTVAMKSATDNAKELSKSLKLEYNKSRQFAITNEIIELAAANCS
ncbi:MAG: ATP synthase F1 subunit gamma [Puniceicoccales bacterium]|jgi:F-type H+-transporting ATPase subunit gamma|nr:ATP synthase F1 subunit gamma [Puniceicoccales bacterium]